MTRPTFVVIGAMKAGTVSLRRYLDAHPRVFLGRGGRFGEPNFFIAEDNWSRGRGCHEFLELVNFTVRCWQRMIHRGPGTKT